MNYFCENHLLRQALAVPLFFLLGLSTLSAETIFNDNFEGYSAGSQYNRVKTAKIVQDPTGSKGGKLLQVTIPKGWGPGITKKLPLSKSVTSACLSYDLYLQNGFEFRKGKLPGLAGGNTPTGCVSADNGFSNRFHFLPDARLTQYQYYPGKTVSCGAHADVGKLTTGRWHTLKSCINLGTPGKNDGTWQTWYDGKSTGQKSIKWRNSSGVNITSLLMHAFYSHDKPSKDIKIYFDNFKVETGAGSTTVPSPDTVVSAPSSVGSLSSRDIGAVAAAGSYSKSGSTVTLKGSGYDIWRTADEFRYAYQPLSGDGEITARVKSLSPTNSWAKAGVMIRENLSHNSKNAMMAITPDNGALLQSRSVVGANSTSIHGPSVSAPNWVRIVRNGSTITGYVSSNGSSWNKVGSKTLSMAQNAYIGLAVTSHNDGAVATTVLENVSIKP